MKKKTTTGKKGRRRGDTPLTPSTLEDMIELLREESPEVAASFEKAYREKLYQDRYGAEDHGYDEINKASHYNNTPARCKNCGQQIECIDIVRWLPFNLGNAVKYIWRHLSKGAPLKDLKKAAYYIEDERKRLEVYNVTGNQKFRGERE